MGFMSALPLTHVVTISEVCKMWQLSDTSVRWGIDSPINPLIARKAGNTFIITIESCIRRWGQPIFIPPDLQDMFTNASDYATL
jgi:hypothetical protein